MARPRAAESELELTPEELLDLDYYLCATDFWYWFENYSYIKDEESGQVFGPGIELWPTKGDYQGQTEFIQWALELDWIIAGKSRRQGISWLCSNLETWDCMFHENVGQAIIAQDDEHSMIHLARDRFIYEAQPAHLRRAVPMIGQDSKHELGLSNGSVIRAYPSTASSVRGLGARRVRCEEVAFWKNAKEAWPAITATAGTTGQVIIVSTGNGEEGLFYDKWQAPGKLRKFFMPYFNRPDFTPEWYEEQRQLLGDAVCLQEYPSVPEDMFLATGSKFWEGLLIRALREKHGRDPIQTRHGGTWRIYAEPDPDGLYVIGADAADGGGDACSASVLDVASGRQVAKISSHVYQADELIDHRWSADHFADHLVELGREYNWAFLGVERNNMGVGTLATLIRVHNYPDRRLYKHEEYDDDKTDTERELKPGWLTNVKSRPVMLTDLRRAVEQADVILADLVSYSQALAFGYYSGKWQHPPSQHDDDVISLAIAQQVRKVVRYLLSLRTHDIQILR
jgi:hypothetical protein